MQLKIILPVTLDATGSVNDPVAFYRKHRKSSDELVCLIQSIHKRSIESQSNNFNKKIIEDWSNAPVEFYHHAMTQYHSFYTFYNWNKKMIGFAGIPERGFLKLFYFLPEFQRLGYGRQGLRFIEKDKNTNAYSRIVLQVHHFADQFYLKQGYSIIRNEEVNINGSIIPVKVMEKYIA